MIILIENDRSTIWLPIYTINGKLDNLYLLLGIFEMISYCITAVLVLKTCRIVYKCKNFHINMNILFIGLLIQWFEAFLAKILVIPYQVGFLKIDDSKTVYISWWTSEIDEMILGWSLLNAFKQVRIIPLQVINSRYIALKMCKRSSGLIQKHE
ncbi:hypothetical protein CRE_06467 [Caenorhabditis remanei]|uniref:Uncharacterized protein n=1 Tax=Caenorhabditis remanei TaxID=31234 RepID=E3M159_CAERE|nr:hypothetical protein CRE_06467 [Caenorhabditis remanei]